MLDAQYIQNSVHLDKVKYCFQTLEVATMLRTALRQHHKVLRQLQELRNHPRQPPAYDPNRRLREAFCALFDRRIDLENVFQALKSAQFVHFELKKHESVWKDG